MSGVKHPALDLMKNSAQYPAFNLNPGSPETMSDKGRGFSSIVSVLEKETFFLIKTCKKKVCVEFHILFAETFIKHSKQDVVYRKFV